MDPELLDEIGVELPYAISDAVNQCRGLLSNVPTQIIGMNRNLSTLQFNSVAFNPTNPEQLIGGTQDNSTFENLNDGTNNWHATLYFADGGESGFDAVDSNLKFLMTQNSSLYVSLGGSGFDNWILATAQLSRSDESRGFYAPGLADPVESKTIFVGQESIWRTKTFGAGERMLNEFKAACSIRAVFIEDGDFLSCGDLEPTGGLNGAPTELSDLTSFAYGFDRQRGRFDYIKSIARASGDNDTLWASNRGGRLFITKNANTANVDEVRYTRVDTLADNDPERTIASITVDPNDPNHAYIVYGGYSENTPNEPGHIFSVRVHQDPMTGEIVDATFISLDGEGCNDFSTPQQGALCDIALNDVAYDPYTGDLYVSTDYGVFMEQGGNNVINWKLAAKGMPALPTPGLTTASEARILYAATFGLGAHKLPLSNNANKKCIMPLQNASAEMVNEQDKLRKKLVKCNK